MARFYLTACLDSLVSKSQLPHKIVNFISYLVIVNNELAILWGMARSNTCSKTENCTGRSDITLRVVPPNLSLSVWALQFCHRTYQIILLSDLSGITLWARGSGTSPPRRTWPARTQDIERGDLILPLVVSSVLFFSVWARHFCYRTYQTIMLSNFSGVTPRARGSGTLPPRQIWPARTPA